MRFEPHEYQERLISLGLQNGALGFLLAPGMGKTVIVQTVFNILKKKQHVNKMLVTAPLRVANSVWHKEAEKWDHLNHLKVTILHGDDKADKLWNSGADIYVINPEGLPWLEKEMQGKRWQWEMLACDESTMYKNVKSLRFKKIAKFLNYFKRRYIMTGSPAPNGLLDLYGQIFILDGGASLGSTYYSYRQKFFDQVGFQGYTWVPRAGATNEIYRRIAPITVRLAAEDYLKLPPLMYNTVAVELPPEAMRVYQQMEELLIAEVAGEAITAANAAAATTKCRQIANGGIYMGAPGGVKEDFDVPEVTDLHFAKIEAVKGLVEELNGKPALIAYEFQHDLKRLRLAFPEAPYLGGGVSASRQAEIERAWNAGELPVLLAQPQSVAHGLNLQGTGAAIIWHSLTWNLEHYEQFIRRIWRQGQTEPVMVHHLVATGTVDEIMVKAIGKKDRNQRELLDALKEYARRRAA